MTIDLENILDRICPLRTLEMAFQSTKISKFSGGACPQTPLVQAVCVTRFNQSECVIFGVDFVLEKSSFERYTS